MTRWLCDSSSTVWNCATSTVQGRRSRRVKPRQMDGWWRGSISPTPSVPPALRRETPGSRPSGGGTHTHTTLTHRVSLMCSSRIMSHHFRAFTFDMTSQTCWFPLTLSPNQKNWRRLKIDGIFLLTKWVPFHTSHDAPPNKNVTKIYVKQI